jgi:hypothetical protein
MAAKSSFWFESQRIRDWFVNGYLRRRGHGEHHAQYECELFHLDVDIKIT